MELTPRDTIAPIVHIVSNREIAPEIFLIAFEAPHLAKQALPGQFVMLSVPPLYDPLLPRPFAVFDVEGSVVKVLYRTVGKGTGQLSRTKKGDLLKVLGPLGNGFSLPDPGTTSIVVAGGIGIASVYFLLVHLLKRATAPTTLLYGVRFKQELIPLEPLEERGLLIRIATEDGRQGVQGTVAPLLQDTLDQGLPETDREYFVCGPLAMLRAVAGRMDGRGVRAQFSLESRMACGYGVCQGCVLPFKDDADPGQVRYRKVCTEGPVFSPDSISWEAIPE